MSKHENRWQRSAVFIVTCLFHGGVVFFLVHGKPAYKSLKTADQFLPIFLVKPQPSIAIALPKQFIIERRSRKRQEQLLDSEAPLPDVSVPPVDNQTAEYPANIDWTEEAQ